MTLTTTEYGVQAEHLLIRGVPPRTIASRLALLLPEVTALMHELTKSRSVERYQLECIKHAEVDKHPEEAAIYLYVRGIPTLKIRTLCGLHEGYEFDFNAKHVYQQKQIEKSLELIRT